MLSEALEVVEDVLRVQEARLADEAEPRDGFLVDLSSRAAPGWWAMIRKYVNPRLSKYADVSEVLRGVGVFGVGARALVAQVSGVEADTLGALAAYAHRPLPAAAEGLVARVPDLGLEGYELIAPPEVEGGLMTLVAAGAVIANLISIRLLSGGRHESLTVRGAYLEVLGDLLGSIAVLVAGVIVVLTGWHQADALASLVVGVLIVPRTVALLRDSLDVLLEATPRGVDLDHVRGHILDAPGVSDVHDLHAWTITSGMNVVSAHVVLTPDAQPGDVLDHLATCLADDFDVKHSTFQLETAEHVAWEARGEHVRH